MRKLADNVLAVADAADERISSSPAESVNALADSARADAEAEHHELHHHPAETVPDDEPRVWRETSQPTEQIDALELDADDDEYGPADEGHPAEHAPGAFDTGEPHGPYYG